MAYSSHEVILAFVLTLIAGLARPTANVWRVFDELGAYRLCTSGTASINLINTFLILKSFRFN